MAQSWPKIEARSCSVPSGVETLHAGVFTVVQRFRSDLGLYVHLHCLITDGAFEERDSAVRFLPAATPTTPSAAALSRARAAGPGAGPRARACRKCGGRMRILDVVRDPDDIACILHGARAPPRPSQHHPPGQILLFPCGPRRASRWPPRPPPERRARLGAGAVLTLTILSNPRPRSRLRPVRGRASRLTTAPHARTRGRPCTRARRQLPG